MLTSPFTGLIPSRDLQIIVQRQMSVGGAEAYGRGATCGPVFGGGGSLLPAFRQYGSNHT